MTMASDPQPGGTGAQSEAVAAAEEELGFVDRRVDLALCLVTLGLGIFLVYASWSIRRGSIPDPIGSGGWARVIGIALIAIAGTLVFRRLVAWRGATSHLVPSDGGKEGEAGYPSSNIRPFVLIAVAFVWVLLVRPLGFLLATFVLTAAAVATMQVRSLPKLIIVPLLFTLITWLLFGEVFGIHFPAGPIEKTLQDIIPRFR
jgi:putative tricarboxylic transport membrane protein